MTLNNSKKELIKTVRYDMMVERIQLLLTHDSWIKADLAYELGINIDELNDMLYYKADWVNPKFAKKVRRLRLKKEKRYGRPKLPANRFSQTDKGSF